MKLYFKLFTLFLLICNTAKGQPAAYSILHNNSSFNRTAIELTSKPVGTIDGGAGTNLSGAATYSIPIKCAPGTNGMIPSLSINYSSHGGNGLLGKGWSLSGLSAITRAGKDMYHDGYCAPVTYTNDDAFLLDGNRLSVKTLTNGADLATYRTEAESYSVTTSYGSFWGGPQYFNVVSKDGSIMQYGNTDDSKVMGDDGKNVMMWRLNKIIDVNGNYISFVYDNTNRDSRISKILYTGNTAGLSPYNVIDFEYVDKYLDKNTIYDGGYSLKQYYLLSKIKLSSEGALYKTYSCNYGLSMVGTTYLKYIEEIASTGAKLNDTRFKYGDESTALSVSSTNISTPIPMLSALEGTGLSSGDYDANGINELIIVSQTAGSTTTIGGAVIPTYSWSAAGYQSAGFASTSYSSYALFSSTPPKSIASIRPFSNGYYPISPTNFKKGAQADLAFSDFNGDGKEDLLSYSITSSGELDKMSIFYPTATAGVFDEENVAPIVKPAMYTANRFVTDHFVTQGDFDGDGATDFITIIKDFHDTRLGTVSFPRKGEINKYLTWPSTPSSPGTYSPLPSEAEKISDADKIVVLDFDGDGKSELLLIKWPLAVVYKLKKESHGGYSLYGVYANTFPLMTEFDDIGVGDFNGDGKTDLLLHKIVGSVPNFEVALSTGTGFSRSGLSLGYIPDCSYGGGDKFFVSDFNNDGKSDILIMQRYCDALYFAKTKFTVYFSSGDQFATSRTLEYTGFVNKDIVPIVSDVNGDGIADLCFQSSTSPYLQYLTCETAYRSQLLEKVKDGFDRTSEFTYEPLTKGTGTGTTDFYTKGSGKSYPVNNSQYPLYVVTSVKMPNGIGGTNTTNFKYENLLLHRAGKGLLGFEKVKSIDLTNDIRTEMFYDLDEEFYVPYLKTSKTFLNSTGVQLSQSDYTVDLKPIIGAPAYCYKQEALGTTIQDLLKGITTTTSNTYDSYGNITNSTTTTTGGETFTNTTTSTFIATGGAPIANRPSLVVSTSKRGSQPTVSTDQNFSYNAKGLLISSVTKPTGAPVTSSVTHTMDYDDFGNLTHKTKSQHYSSYIPYTAYEYDSKGRFVTIEENTLGHKKYYTTHKFWGKPLSVKDFNGLTTSYTYDSWGKLTSTTIPTSGSSSYTINYSDAWDIGSGSTANQLYYTLIQDPSAPDIKTWYDYLGRAIRTKQESFGGAWTESHTTYDARGNVASSTNNYLPSETPITTTNSYDAYNRISSSSDHIGTTSYSYTLGAGLEKTTINLPDGSIKKTTTDALGKMIESNNGSTGGTLLFEYDSRGNEIATRLRGAFGPITTLVTKKYDIMGGLEEMNDADAGTYRYGYDACGRIINSLDPNYVHTGYQYDIADRIVEKTITKGSDVYHYEYSYFDADKDDRPMETKVTGPDGVVTEYFDYQIGGGLTSYTKDVNGTFLSKYYTYDSYNRPLATIYPAGVIFMPWGTVTGSGSGFSTLNHYDANGFLTKITSNTTPARTLYEATAMNGSGQITEFNRLGALSSSITYTNNLPTQYSTSGIQDLSMDYDYRNGNVLWRRKGGLPAPAGLEEGFSYDALERLTKSDVAKTISGVSGTVTTHSLLDMAYDKPMSGTMSLGRIVSKSDVGAYSYSGFPLNAVKEIVLNASGTGVVSHETQNIEYNLFHKTRKITEQVGGLYYEEKMLYDADEDRAYTQQSQGASPTSLTIARQRWYMGDYEMQQIGSNTQYIHYISSDAGLVAMVVKDAGGFHYYPVFTDHLGSIVKVTDEYGTTIAEQNYDAWGRERDPDTWDYYTTSPPAKPDWLYRGYTGHEMLPEYGLINMNGRIYDPANGRMLRPDNYIQDLLNSQSYNRYSYCWNNPLKYTDPSGEIITWALNSGGFSIGVNFTPLGVPLGTGINVGYGNGFSLGAYGEVGPRVGGTGFGSGATISQSFDYNFGTETASTTTSAGVYGSFGAFNAGASGSYTYDITNKRGHFDWSATAGVGVGGSKGGFGLNVGYGSNGMIWGMGGWTQSPVNTVAENRAKAKSAKSTAQIETVNDEIQFVSSSDEQIQKATAYINEAAASGVSKAQIIKGLQQQGIQVVGNRVSIKANDKVLHYDINGAEHKGVPTPHVQQSVKNVNPKTGQIFFNKDNNWVRPMNQKDIRIIRNYLKRK